MADEPTSDPGEPEGPASGAPRFDTSEIREQLIGQLHRTVEGVNAAIDEAGRQAFDAAQAEARRQAEEAADRIDALSEAQLRRLTELSDELVDRARSLSDQVAALAGEAERGASELRDPGGPASFEQPHEPVPSEQPANEARPRDARADPDALDDGEVAPGREQGEVEAPRLKLRRFRRRPRDQDAEVPEGVRMVVEQMRIGGAPESEIEARLAELGVVDPAGVIAAVGS